LSQHPLNSLPQAVVNAYCCFCGCYALQEEDFNAHIAGLPLEYAVTAAGAAASGASSPTLPPGSSSSSSSSKAGDAAAATDKLLAALSQAVDAQVTMNQN
jgi:hypothetical protein